MLESQVNSAIVDHVFKKNELVSDRQLAYRKGLSTETMLIHLTEKWRNLIGLSGSLLSWVSSYLRGRR